MKTTAYVGQFTEVKLGLGEVVCGHSIDFRGLPALTFSPAPARGTPGDDFVPENDHLHLKEGSVVISFANKEAVIQHLERLDMLVRAIEAGR